MLVWYGLLAPARTPREIVMRLYTEIAKTLARPDMKEFLERRGFEPGGNTPEQFAQIIRTDLPRWEKVIRQARIKAE